MRAGDRDDRMIALSLGRPLCAESDRQPSQGHQLPPRASRPRLNTLQTQNAGRDEIYVTDFGGKEAVEPSIRLAQFHQCGLGQGEVIALAVRGVVNDAFC